MRNILTAIILLFITACTTTRYVEKEVPVVETRIEYKDKLVYDSVYLKDSTLVFIKGDTVFKYKEVVNTKFLYKTDTIVKRDSIPYPVKVVETEIKEVNNLHWWQEALIYLGLISLGFILYKLLKTFNKWT